MSKQHQYLPKLENIRKSNSFKNQSTLNNQLRNSLHNVKQLNHE